MQDRLSHGNRLKGSRPICDCIEQAFVVPCCCFSSHFYACLVWYLFDDIERIVADEGYVCRAVLGSKPHQIVVKDHMEAVLWIARTGGPWRDLPPEFGKWNTVFKRFREWVKRDVSKRIFDALSEEPDMEYAMIDGTIVKVHRHGQGEKGDSEPGYRQVQGRINHQNHGVDRCFGQSGSL